MQTGQILMTKTRQVFSVHQKRKIRKVKVNVSNYITLSSSKQFIYCPLLLTQVTAPLPYLLVGLNNDTERYPLIFSTIEYQSYDIFDKKNSGFTRNLQLSKASIDLRAGKRLSSETERKNTLRLQIFYIGI